MRYVLFVLGVVIGGLAGVSFVASSGAVQQAAAGTLLIVAAIFIGAAAVADEVRQLRRDLAENGGTALYLLRKLSGDEPKK